MFSGIFHVFWKYKFFQGRLAPYVKNANTQYQHTWYTWCTCAHLHHMAVQQLHG